MNVFELFGSVGLNTENFDKGISAISSSVSDITGIISTVISVVKKFDSALTSASGVMGEVVVTTFEFAKAIDDNVMDVVGKANTAVVGAFTEMTDAAIEFFRSTFKEGVEFDTAMGQVGATMQTSLDDLNDMTVTTENFTGTLRDFAKKLGAETAFTSTEAAQGLNILAQAGLTAEEQVRALPTVLNLAAAGNIDLGTSATYVTAAVKGFCDEMGNASYYADLIAKGATLANTSVNSLGDAFSMSAANAAAYNQTAESMEISLLRFAEQNLTGSEAATAYNRLLMDIFTPKDKAVPLFDELGITRYNNGVARDLNDIINELSAALSQLDDESKLAYENEIFSAWGMKAFNKMAVTSTEKLSLFNTELAHASDEEGAAAIQAKTQLSSLGGLIKLLESAYSGIKTNVFDKILPLTREFIINLTAGFSKTADYIREGNYFAAFSTVGKTIGEMITEGVKIVLENEDTINEILLGLVDALSKVGNALFSGGSKLLPRLLSHITFFATNIIRRFSNFLSKEENVKIITDTIQDLIDQANDFFTSNRDQIYNIVSTLIDIAIEFVDDIFLMRRSTIYSILGEKLIDIIENLPDKINEWLSSDGLNDTIDAVFDFVDRLATTLLNSASEILPPLLVFAVNLGTRIIQGIADFLSDEENKEKIIGIINLLTAAIVGFFRENEDSIYSIIDSALDIAERVFPRVFEARREPMAKIIWHVISEIWSRAWNEFANSEEVGRVLGEVWSKLKVWFYGMLGETGTDDFVKGLQKFGLKIWIKIYNWFVETRQKIVDEVTKIKDKIFEVLEENKFLDIGKNIVHGIWKGICSVNNWMYEKITGWANNDVLGWFENAFQIGSPSKVFENRIGVFLAQGIGVGFEEEMDKVQEDMAKSIPTDFDMTPQINTTEKNKTGNFFFEFNIGNMSGISEKDGIAFAETISQLLYSETYRKKEAFS